VSPWNKISDENAKGEIKDNLEFTPSPLANLEASADANEKLKHLPKVAELNFETGALLYQQEAPKGEVLSHLRSPADCYVSFFPIRPKPTELESRFVGEVEPGADAMNAAVVFSVT
jgi:hypothetical protein